MTIRMSVDVGGTFTDLVAYDSSHSGWVVAKVPTTPSNPADGVLAAAREAARQIPVDTVDYFVHGTTVGLNAVLERRGATVGLITTAGFRDVLELRRSDRESPYDLFWRQPVALAPRRLRKEVHERISAGGEILTPLNAADIAVAVDEFRQAGVTAIAICFMNAYVNPEHERAAERLVRESGFDGSISLSHGVSSEYREYERFSTTVIDAFVKGRMANYLDQLGAGLRDLGFSGTLLCSRSGGGALTFEEASARPFETLLSGPVGAPAGGASLPLHDLGNEIVTADVGGTSFDTCLVVDGRPQVMYQGSIGGLPVLSEWVDVRSIGSGGGSIARADHGLLRVGPQSAGAEPGPAAYGRGGTEPTVTDAAAVLGMLGPGNLAGGIDLDEESARRALTPLASELNLSIDDAARGIIQIASSSMANAIREITIEQGRDPRPMVLLPVGGAGPMLASALVTELDMETFVVPMFAGNFSAYGLLTSDIVETRALTKIIALTDENLADISQTAASIFDKLRSPLPNGPGTSVGSSDYLTLDIRYKGQEHSLNVEVPWGDRAVGASAEDLRRQFEEAYKSSYGVTLGDAIEVVALRPSRRWALESHTLPSIADGHGSKPAPVTKTRSLSLITNEWLSFDVYDRGDLLAGQVVAGPAIVTEPTSTTYIDKGFTATVSAEGMLIVRREG